MIRVVFLAQLREQLRIAEMDIAIEQIETIGELKKQLVLQNPTWGSVLLETKILAAVNHAYAKENHVVVDGDEVAFFPPVTGG